MVDDDDGRAAVARQALQPRRDDVGAHGIVRVQAVQAVKGGHTVGHDDVGIEGLERHVELVLSELAGLGRLALAPLVALHVGQRPLGADVGELGPKVVVRGAEQAQAVERLDRLVLEVEVQCPASGLDLLKADRHGDPGLGRLRRSEQHVHAAPVHQAGAVVAAADLGVRNGELPRQVGLQVDRAPGRGARVQRVQVLAAVLVKVFLLDGGGFRARLGGGGLGTDGA